MIDQNPLYFYYSDEFTNLSTYPELKNKKVFSISNLLNVNQIDESTLKDFDLENRIIDLSYLSTLSSPQRIFEPLYAILKNLNILFLADYESKRILETELRFCFDSFKLLPSSTSNFGKPKAVTKIVNLDLDAIEAFKTKFSDSLYGHEKFKYQFYKHIDTFKVFNKLEEHKVLSLFLLGESGVGKTEVARVIHKILGGNNRLAKVNFGNYSDHTSLNSLIGSSRGYIGSDDGEIFKRVRESDTGVILIDEFEKGNPTVYNFFLSALETGIMTNSLGDDINIDGYIIVFTSNISKEDFKSKISPELRSRFDYKCRFSLLRNNDKLKYTNFRINNIINKYESKFSRKLPNEVRTILLTSLSMKKFNNMRDLNKELKSRFIDYINNPNN